MAAVLDRPIDLTEEEIGRMTGYRRPGKQMETLKALGIPLRRRQGPERGYGCDANPWLWVVECKRI